MTTEVRIAVADLLAAIDAAHEHWGKKVQARIEAEQAASLAWRHLLALEERLQKEHGLRRVSKENPT